MWHRRAGAMIEKPRILDLYCGLGGAAAGYRAVGWHVTGVDIVSQPDYAGHDFVRQDALTYLAKHGYLYDAIHASPPCQNYSTLTQGNRRRDRWHDNHADLIGPTRDMILDLGLPYVLENVQAAPVRPDLILCGLMFGLRVFRHRLFELGGWHMATPFHPSHRGHRVAGWRHGIRYKGDMVAVYGDGGGKGSVAEWQNAMDIHWTTNRAGIAEAIPPAYTRYIGSGLLSHTVKEGDGDVAQAHIAPV